MQIKDRFDSSAHGGDHREGHASGIDGNAGNDSLLGTEGDDTLRGFGGNDTIDGDDGDDEIFGGLGDDSLLGGAGNDRFDGGPGDDFIDGGAGDFDFLVLGFNGLLGADVDLLTGVVTDVFGDADTVSNIYGVQGSHADDTIRGSDTANFLVGFDGDDLIEGRGGNDDLFAGPGDDTITGGAGSDTLTGGEGADVLDGGDGHDDRLVLLNGLGGSDTSERPGAYANLETGIVRDAFGYTDTIVNIEDVRGSQSNDTIIGDAGDNFIFGDWGDDNLSGGGGDDEIDGGLGADTIAAGAGVDLLTGGAEADTFILSAGDGIDSITDFDVDLDILDLSETVTEFTSRDSIVAAASDTARDGLAGLFFDTGGGDGIFLIGRSTIDLSNINFVIDGTNLEPEPNPDTIAADETTTATVNVNDTVIGTIDTGSDIDAYAVNFIAGVEYGIALTGISLSDPLIPGILDPNGNLVPGTSDDDGGFGLNSFLTFTPSVSGTYYIQAGSYSNFTGTYELLVAALTEPDTETSDGGAAVLNQDAPGVIDFVGDTDNYTITLQAGVTYAISLAGDTLFDPFIAGLLDPDGVAVPGASNDDGGIGLNSLVVFTPAVTGTYTIEAGAFGSDTGSYNLFIEEVGEGSHIVSENPTIALPLSGDALVDSLLFGFGYGPDADGDFNITYSFPVATDLFSPIDYPRDSEPDFDFAPLSANAQALFRTALAQVSSFTNANFIEIDETTGEVGTIRAAWAGFEEEGTLAYAFVPLSATSNPLVGDIWFLSQNLSEDAFNFQSILVHELGHALGLEHPFEADASGVPLPPEFDNLNYTIMSYTSSAVHDGVGDLEPQTFMALDILALQHLFGVDTVTTAGDQTYDFDQSARHYLTIWDYGGNDTLSVSGGARAVSLDLTPGSWSNVGTTINYSSGATENRTIFITADTVIENAIGGGGNDTLRGNDADNRLMAGAGADFIAGGEGDDTVSGGAGDDQIFAGGANSGDDIFVGGAGADTIGGGDGDDLIVGGSFDDAAIAQVGIDDATGDGADILFGGAGNDTLIGGGFSDGVNDNGRYNAGEADGTGLEANQIWSGTGDDLAFGARGNDTIGGGAGDDNLQGGGGNDVFYGGQGDADDTGVNDVINGGNGNDTVFAGAGNDSIIGGTGNDELFNGGGTDTVDGGDGSDTLFGGGGDDVITGGSGVDLFAFFAGNGDDTVSDFEVGIDSLDLAGTAFDFTDLASVQAAASNATIDGASGLLIDTGGGDSVFLTALSLDDLASINIVF